MTPRKPEPHRATTRGNILKLVNGNSKRGSIAKDAAAAKARMQSDKAIAASIRQGERRK